MKTGPDLRSPPSDLALSWWEAYDATRSPLGKRRPEDEEGGRPAKVEGGSEDLLVSELVMVRLGAASLQLRGELETNELQRQPS